MSSIRTLIVDDERLARQRIRRLLADEPDIEIVGEAANARQGAETALDLSPDLMFLDIQMPKGDGFELMETLRGGRVPAVIFVTAYEQYALRAFDVDAEDYLLKPFQESRFRAAVQRARNALRNKLEAARRFPESAGKRGADMVLIRSAGRVSFVKTRDIDWIESADNYVRLHVGQESHIVRETMAAFEARLQEWQFVRIHRSTIVNLEKIVEFRPWFNGDFMAVLKDGQRLKMSRTYRDRVRDVLGHSI